MKKTIALITIGFAISNAFADPSAHTWHTVTAKNSSYKASLHVINETANFIDANGNNINSFEVSPEQPYKFGFQINRTNDFNLAYSLTLTEKDNPRVKKFTSKACVFVVSANAPAKPDIRSFSYHGATCEYTTRERGNFDFVIS